MEHFSKSSFKASNHSIYCIVISSKILKSSINATQLFCINVVVVFSIPFIKKLNVLFNTGELDPERIGSGIQYGDATLRRLNQGQSQRPKPGAECIGSSCRI